MMKLTESMLFAERYLFQRLLGRGGFSEVWLATDKMTNLEIAIKVYAPGQGMDTDGMKDFCKELSQVYNLNHTNLLKPQHVDNWEGMPYLVMTYCPQGSCHCLIGKMTEDQIWRMLHDVSSGLAYLHDQEIVHQDIKPDNILVDLLGNYVITDFGISVQSRSTLRKSMSMASGSGTTAYMGPERFSADPTPLKASDIWSLGATAYELLTGNAPFGEIGGGMQKGGADLPTIKQNISSELRVILSKMLALETWDRPTAKQLEIWTEDPKSIDFSKINENIQVKNDNDISFGIDKKFETTKVNSNKGYNKFLIIGIIIVVLIFSGIFVGYMHMKKVEANRKKEYVERSINIHRDLGNKCDKYIADLNGRNILDKIEDVVYILRELENFEENNKIASENSFSQDKMVKFLGKIESIKASLEDDLNVTYKDYDKDGVIYRNTERKIERIREVLYDVSKSNKKSANDIKLRGDNF